MHGVLKGVLKGVLRSGMRALKKGKGLPHSIVHEGAVVVEARDTAVREVVVLGPQRLVHLAESVRAPRNTPKIPPVIPLKYLP